MIELSELQFTIHCISLVNVSPRLQYNIINEITLVNQMIVNITFSVISTSEEGA